VLFMVTRDSIRIGPCWPNVLARSNGSTKGHGKWFFSLTSKAVRRLALCAAGTRSRFEGPWVLIQTHSILILERLASKWTYPRTKVGRPGVMKEIRALIVQMADEDRRWGYCRIPGGPHARLRTTRREHSRAPRPHARALPSRRWVVKETKPRSLVAKSAMVSP
jgi:hypothetical protein